MTQQVKIAPSRINGHGVFAVVDLVARRKVGEVSGSLVKLPEARRAIENRPKIYLVELSRRLALDCSAGNCFKYLNHSCTPNCYLRVFRHRVQVYARQTIRAGTELTVDYGVTPHRRGMACRCGSMKCKRRL
jgi:uncharacterized protein